MNITIAMSDIAIAKELYQRLETYRQAAGISQEKLVENLGISRPTYARIQKGTCSLGTFISVLRALNLLEGLNILVPTRLMRPSEIVALSSTGSKKTAKMSVAEMLANRNKSRFKK